MGPRGFARGWKTPAVGFASNAPLQWGRGGLPADGTWPVVDRSDGFQELQWGRGGLPADGPRRWRRRRPSSSFNGAAGVCPRMGGESRAGGTRAGLASMGPRGFARGWLLRRIQPRRSNNCFNGAAGVCPRMGVRGPGIENTTWRLQWGRGGLPADGLSATATRAKGKPGFNGAAGVCPRMAAFFAL